jgi:hypothetical protein
VEHHGLGHLEDQLLGLQARFLEDLAQVADEVGLLELLR